MLSRAIGSPEVENKLWYDVQAEASASEGGKKPEFGQLPPVSIPEVNRFLVGGAFKWSEAYIVPIESPRIHFYQIILLLNHAIDTFLSRNSVHFSVESGLCRQPDTSVRGGILPRPRFKGLLAAHVRFRFSLNTTI